MSEGPVILFDGICNYCNSVVNFLISQDKRKIFRFAPLQSNAAQRILKQNGLETADFNSFVLVENGAVFLRSTAALKIFKHLPWYWQWVNIGWLLPLFVRDALYNLIARNRYKWFGQRSECMIPTKEIKSRFLDSDLTTHK